MSKPRHNCHGYFVEKKITKPVQITKREFDFYVNKGQFKDGPFRETFGDGDYEPYNPYRQAFGTLKDGTGVYCELADRPEDET